MKRVKITVLKKAFYEDLAERYLTDGAEAGFCPWAWIDIYHNLGVLEAGGTYSPWNTRDGETVVCCSDGIRPVTFELQVAD